MIMDISLRSKLKKDTYQAYWRKKRHSIGYWRDNAPTNPTYRAQKWHCKDKSFVEPNSWLENLQTVSISWCQVKMNPNKYNLTKPYINETQKVYKHQKKRGGGVGIQQQKIQ